MRGAEHRGVGPAGRRRSGLSRGGVVAAVAVLAVAAVCVRLGFWQLDRLEQRRARNAAIEASLALAPVALDSGLVAALRRDPEPLHFRRVRVRGVYAPEAEVIQRGRSLDGRPGVYLLTPMRVVGTDWAVLVNRGWAASPDALSLDPAPLSEPGVREVEGILELFPAGVRETNPVERSVGETRVVSVQRLDPEVVRGRLATPLLTAAYVQQLPGGEAPPEGVYRLPLPEVGEGPHLGYAVQWFSFAAIAVIGLGVLAIRSRGTGA